MAGSGRSDSRFIGLAFGPEKTLPSDTSGVCGLSFNCRLVFLPMSELGCFYSFFDLHSLKHTAG